MSKRGGFPGGMGGFGGMNINSLMKEAKKMQADLEKSQTELAAKEFEASAGGGAVTVKVTGQKEIKELKSLNIEISEQEINKAINKARERISDDKKLKEKQ